MITINVKTQAVTNAQQHRPQVWSKYMYFNGYPLNITPGYIRGHCPPNYPVPAVEGVHETPEWFTSFYPW